MTDVTSFHFLQLSFEAQPDFHFGMIFLVFRKLCPGTVCLHYKGKMSLRLIIITVLDGTQIRSFLNMIEPSDSVKSLLWIFSPTCANGFSMLKSF